MSTAEIKGIQADQKRQYELNYQQEQSPQKLLISNRLSDYLSIMDSYTKEILDKRAEHIMMLEANEICYEYNSFSNQFSISVKQTSINCEVVVFECRWGNFIMLITVLNVANNKVESGVRNQIGSFGQVQKVEHRQGSFIMKTLHFKQSNQDFVRYASLREWFLLRICSALHIGPYLKRYIGFDLIFYKNCVDFAMQECTRPQIDPSKKKCLYSELSLMHGFNIVHTDIKVENIMFSPTYKKCVFIDFGLSKIIVEPIGFKSLTRFSGSLNYATEEMAALFHSSDEGPVDLYFNDVHCLKISLWLIRSTQKVIKYNESFMFQEQLSIYMEYISYFAEFEVKYLLFTSNFDNLAKNWKKISQLLFQSHNINEILNFSQEIKPNRKLHSFLVEHLPELYEWNLKHRQIKGANSQQEIQEENPKKMCFMSYFANFSQMSECDLHTYRNAGKVRGIIYDQGYHSHTSDAAYLRLYLIYISYLNNFYRTSNSQRFEAAKMFYHNFLKKQPQSKDKKTLIQSSIIRSLQWINDDNNTNQEQSSQIQEILILLPQFLLILDFDYQVFVYWLQVIFHHKCLSLELQLVFLYNMNDFKIILRSRKKNPFNKSRKQMIKKIEKFYLQKRGLIQANKVTPKMWMTIKYLLRDHDNNCKQMVAFIQSKKMENEIKNSHLRQVIKIESSYVRGNIFFITFYLDIQQGAIQYH